MWVYQQQEANELSSATAAEAALQPLAERPAEPRPVPQVQREETSRPEPEPRKKSGARRSPAPTVGRLRERQATRDCILLAAAYLLGTAAAGVLQALCDTQQLKLLGCYMERWRELFLVGGPDSAAALFGAEYLAAAGAATVLLLLGLSAFGPTLIFLFVMLYGMGAGLLTAQLFSGLGWKGIAVCLVFSGVPMAAAAACLCVFGASALQVSSRLHAFSFAPRGSSVSPAGARVLLGQYLLAAVALVPLCGVATGLAVLAGRFPLG